MVALTLWITLDEYIYILLGRDSSRCRPRYAASNKRSRRPLSGKPQGYSKRVPHSGTESSSCTSASPATAVSDHRYYYQLYMLRRCRVFWFCVWTWLKLELANNSLKLMESWLKPNRGQSRPKLFHKTTIVMRLLFALPLTCQFTKASPPLSQNKQ